MFSHSRASASRRAIDGDMATEVLEGDDGVCRSRIPVETAILNGFGDVLGGDRPEAGEVGDRTRDLENAIVPTGGEAKACHGPAEEGGAIGVGGAPPADLASRHARVDARRRAGEALPLPRSRRDHALANCP